METLNTISRNFQVLANANIDWSPDAGPFWLVLMVVGSAITMGIAAWTTETN